MSPFSVATAILWAALLAGALPAQTYTCYSPTSDHTVGLHAEVVSLVTGSDALVIAKRDTLRLLPASASQVSIVTQTNKCKSAAQAYHAAVRPGTPAISRSMIVIKVANSRYVLADPTERQGEYGTIMSTDASFNRLRMMSW